MDILIRDADEKRDRLLKEISELEKEIQGTNLSEAITKNYGILKGVLQGHQEYVREKKMRKLKRDAIDYSTGRVLTYSLSNGTDIMLHRGPLRLLPAEPQGKTRRLPAGPWGKLRPVSKVAVPAAALFSGCTLL
ncbi:hypothetical protein NDU88_001713 [Pleurodeles waltl]|uniref:Uncharacterized protein n=1 Tax=Pleurodeles waltl TaxID=8319 RepID=A0AAV7MKJ4_PLEWA|nr:hypothetical protein NDU88_001713 [Pleurodeles waltl]